MAIDKEKLKHLANAYFSSKEIKDYNANQTLVIDYLNDCNNTNYSPITSGAIEDLDNMFERYTRIAIINPKGDAVLENKIKDTVLEIQTYLGG